MRLIDADKLKEKLTQIRNGVVNKEVARGSTISYVWEAAYLLIFDEYIKMLDEMPSATWGSDADAILDAYGKGYSKGREDVLSEIHQMEDYYKNDCDALHEAYDRGYAEGFSNRRR